MVNTSFKNNMVGVISFNVENSMYKNKRKAWITYLSAQYF